MHIHAHVIDSAWKFDSSWWISRGDTTYVGMCCISATSEHKKQSSLWLLPSHIAMHGLHGHKLLA